MDAADGHVTVFTQMMSTLTGMAENLQAWMAALDADDLPGRHSYTCGIRRDLDGVVNRLTLVPCSGAVEGNMTNVKALKRSRYE